MKFAIVEGERIEPTPRTRGSCPHCRETVISKCGKVRVWHWAHKSKQHCDRWWESETEWHRQWKDKFPIDWQERGRRDESGELHVADVLTPGGLVIEFQNSPINREEVESRTNFHKNICWVVNGMRLESSLKQFNEALEWSIPLMSTGVEVRQISLGSSRLLKRWSGLNAPVVIDFNSDTIWVIGRTVGNYLLIYPLNKNVLVEQLKQGRRPQPVQVGQRTQSSVRTYPRRRGVGRRM